MTLDRLIKAVLKYMDERGMLETVKKQPPSHRSDPRQKIRQEAAVITAADGMYFWKHSAVMLKSA